MNTRFAATLAALAVSLLFAWLLLTRTQPQKGDSRQHILWLAAGTPKKQVDHAFESLNAAGVTAFPMLIEHLDDKTPADERFERAVVETTPDGSRIPYKPTIGNVCFDILQEKIEGVWPKSLRAYHVVTPEWLRAHAGMELRELQATAAREAMDKAKAQSDDRAVKFFEGRLGDLLQLQSSSPQK